MTTFQQYYLLIRPISEDSNKVEPYIKSLSDITGLDPATVKQKFVGTGINIIKIHQNQDILENISKNLKKDGFPSAVINNDELIKVRIPLRITSLDIGQKSIKFINSGEDIDISLNGTEKCLIVLSTLDIKGIQKKRINRLIMNQNKPFSTSEMLRYIFHSHPIMDIYISSYDIPIRIDGFKFNYHCLGENDRKSVALNFSFIIKLIKQFSLEVILDTAFGENSFPFLHLSDNVSEEIFYKEFAVYSYFIFLVYKKGIYNTVQRENPSNIVTLMEGMEGIIWGGPLFLPEEAFKKIDFQSSDEKVSETKDDSLPPPPQMGVVYRSYQISTFINAIKLYWRIYRRYVRTLGPATLVYPLTIIGFSSFILLYTLGNPLFLSIGLISIGSIFFTHSFVILKQKRVIENCPTSKISTMPMGDVEVKGHARQKYYLKSPFSNTDCVYYSYKVYENILEGKTSKEALREWGESGRIPFYLEDETGRVLILPESAIIHAITSQTVSDRWLNNFGIISSSFEENNRKIIERVISNGQFLYIKGFARRLKSSNIEKKKTFIERLREIKKEPYHLKKYDFDKDGNISTEEWETAKEDIEEKMLMEEMYKGDVDRVAIGEHPTGGLFYISDKQEKILINSMSWRIPLFFIGGITCIIKGCIYFLKI